MEQASQYLCSVRELCDNLDNSGWLVFDCRFSLTDREAGHRSYQESHIPGALFVDLNRDLSASHVPGVTGRHPLPEKNVWLSRVAGLGITPEHRIVVYDSAGGAGAARMWWMLRWIGHADVRVLDGGWQSWIQSELPLSGEEEEPGVATENSYGALPSLTRLVEAEMLENYQGCILDARDPERFRGDVEPLDLVAGHIPGARSSPFSDNLDESGQFKSAEALREKFSCSSSINAEAVCYCGSGVTAAHNILAMKIAGFSEPLLYAGSWSEWICDPMRPVATGDEE